MLQKALDVLDAMISATILRFVARQLFFCFISFLLLTIDLLFLNILLSNTVSYSKKNNTCSIISDHVV